MHRMPRLGRPAALASPRRGALTALLAVLVSLAAAGCEGGAIAADTPASSGQSFVSGSYGATFYQPGSRPQAPAVTGTTLAGRPLSLRSYRGHIVVLNFWASWCAPCREEAPALAALARHFQSAGVRFIGVDIQDNVASAEAFVRTFGIGYPSLNDPGDQIALAFRAAVPAAIPSTLVIDGSGRVAALIIDGVTYQGLKALITQVAAKSI